MDMYFKCSFVTRIFACLWLVIIPSIFMMNICDINKQYISSKTNFFIEPVLVFESMDAMIAVLFYSLKDNIIGLIAFKQITSNLCKTFYFKLIK